MRKLPFFYIGFVSLLLAAITILPSAAWSASSKTDSNVLDPQGVARLSRDAGAGSVISLSPVTGGVRFVSFDEGKAAKAGLTRSAGSFQERSMAFFKEYGSVFGLRNASQELQLRKEQRDRLGWNHISYKQQYLGVPVFAGELKAHYDAAGNLRAMNGTIIPNINLNATPSLKSADASRIALDKVGIGKTKDSSVSVKATQLYVYRAGLAQGIPGKNHLVWEVEIGNNSTVRDFLYVDAHSGQLVDKVKGVMDELDRRAFDGLGETAVPPSNWPDNPFFVEGDPFPTGNAEANNMLESSQETHELYFNAFGYDSFDGLGSTMDAIFNRGNACPNASWNGVFISFCPGLTTDDVTGHEWTHAYTQYTHNLIYGWQPGALNESYSDIFGETIDQINGRGTDAPNTPRTQGECSSAQIFPPFTTATSPANLA
jgi:Zn-dependent metalloprotease